MNLNLLRERVFRLKNLPSGNLDTQLRRCLTTFDITLLGIGHMIGAGIYVLTGSVVRYVAGPSVVVSFLIAGVASLLSALCYAEFGARFPKAGSAYTYAYVGVGELWAFIIGWNIILEHMVGAAAVARSWSGYLDSLLGNAISNSTMKEIGRFSNTSLLADYPDFTAFLLIIVVAIFVGLGSKVSTNFNSTFTIINMAVICVVIGYGITYADFSLWSGYDENGKSKFFPYGVNGMMAGAASCFFAYIGFDGLATAGEEAKDPSRSIPIATFTSMSVVTLAYILMAASLTLMIPYYEVHPTAAFSDAFALKGATIARYAVSIGALCGMMTSLVGGMFALPRCVFAMAEDGLLFKDLAVVNSKTQVPINAIIVFGSLTAIIALLFDITTLVEFLSIGTLLAYTIVSACVITLRYQPAQYPEDDAFDNAPGHAIYYSISLMTFGFVWLSTSLPTVDGFFNSQHILDFSIGLIISLAPLLFITLHHQNSVSLSFRVPLVPLLPATSMFLNIAMMVHLSVLTWVRLFIWLTIGFVIYFFYGMKHSKEELPRADPITKSSTYDSVVTASTLPDD
ncbi:unnamed protein product [Auanema sp. JU1783]|nr:unnamed protein product [Auanema sp. JU1783]